jgi:group II intron reverse transcriptase/maturase
MHGRGKSYKAIRPGKRANKGGGALQPAELVEERALTKGNPPHRYRIRAQERAVLQQAEERIRQIAQGDKEVRFTSLWHHVYNIDRLRQAYFNLEPKAAAGVDGETWQTYGRDLEGNLRDLSERLKRGAYRARPVLRVYIPKGDGRQRPIGIPALEDKIVQRATVEVLNAVYEADFLGFSYGFRPGRGQHNALDAVTVGIEHRKVNWVLDADIRGFFDAIGHEWMMKFVEHRVADERVLRHVKKWLKAGVIEKEVWSEAEAGTPQGGSISPLLANIYLHYVFDLWVQQWRRRHAHGDMIVVRYADDFIVGFEHKTDAERFQRELAERLQKFHLELHPDKTRLIEFGRYAAERRERRSQGRPETFSFLGFLHICGRKRAGGFTVRRKTLPKRLRAKLAAIRDELRRRLHHAVPEVGRWLRTVLQGYYNYHAVPGNLSTLKSFRHRVYWMWRHALVRRSQRSKTTRARMQRLADRWLPGPRILHPYPDQRLRV